jgi:hypothetical protein
MRIGFDDPANHWNDTEDVLACRNQIQI